MEPRHRVLQRRVDEVMHYMWDPIGVAAYPGARSEYESYVPQVLGLLLSGAGEAEIAKHLTGIESLQMGLAPMDSRAAEVAAVLIGYRDWVGQEPA